LLDVVAFSREREEDRGEERERERGRERRRQRGGGGKRELERTRKGGSKGG
jgi:hypothetical protein